MAYEKLDKLEDAFKDASLLLKVEPKNVAVKPVLARLTPIIRERVSTNQVFYILYLISLRTLSCLL